MQTIKNVYLVDDDQDDRIIFAEVLREVSQAVNLREITGGEELCNILNDNPEPMPDVIFLNINMPVKNGFECLQEIRSRNDQLRDIKIIMYSTSQNPDSIYTALELGADFYAVKPADVASLRSLLEKVMTSNIFNDTSSFVLR
ncbi:hypothetical protein ASE21_21380 [Flavobacterium sp. Root901]|uniref:response regulator n=1 Tax=Flavobacterium sp. Root901 TaxID=1736605 RepID=UPI00070F83AF|nr:response regulator [Flavobacterium sp. Root901]KRD12114.1 hypothetical protein ASE21_21380 [Flavobacterium sp. Root901]